MRARWLALGFALALGCRSPAPVSGPRERALALDAVRWIDASAVESDAGTLWPAVPGGPVGDVSLYSGSSGVVLFQLLAYRATGERRYLQRARSGADALVARLDSIEEPGLYTGLAGVGFVLGECARVSGDERHRQAARRCVELLEQRARPAGAGLEWNATTDVIAGGAGIGLFLLHAARELERPAARECAERAGERLIELATSEPGGLSWAMDPAFPRRMPNFSHGTAGVAYFLARLYEETGRCEFLEAALGGARYLLSIARTDGNTCLVFHDEPDGRELFYLGWCHGPVGTARLFYQLRRVTREPEWLAWTERSARAILASGIPERATPGFWNNAGPCCGLAGVAEFFFDLHRVTRRGEYLDFSRLVTDVLRARATRDAAGARWIQAEHRVRPQELAAQTGWMQGAAGIGAWLLRLDAFEQGGELRCRLPDTPF
jgi:lantibiotic modifying enzyme